MTPLVIRKLKGFQINLLNQFIKALGGWKLESTITQDTSNKNKTTKKHLSIHLENDAE